MDDLFRSLVLSMIGGGHLLIDISNYRESDIDIGKKVQQFVARKLPVSCSMLNVTASTHVEDIFYWFVFSSQGASSSGAPSRMFGGIGNGSGGEQGPSKALLEGLSGKKQMGFGTASHSPSEIETSSRSSRSGIGGQVGAVGPSMALRRAMRAFRRGEGDDGIGSVRKEPDAKSSLMAARPLEEEKASSVGLDGSSAVPQKRHPPLAKMPQNLRSGSRKLLTAESRRALQRRSLKPGAFEPLDEKRQRNLGRPVKKERSRMSRPPPPGSTATPASSTTTAPPRRVIGHTSDSEEDLPPLDLDLPRDSHDIGVSITPQTPVTQSPPEGIHRRPRRGSFRAAGLSMVHGTPEIAMSPQLDDDVMSIAQKTELSSMSGGRPGHMDQHYLASEPGDIHIDRSQFHIVSSTGVSLDPRLAPSVFRSGRSGPTAPQRVVFFLNNIDAASERTQSALIEVIAHNQVLVSGKLYSLPPNCVIVASVGSSAETFLIPSLADRFLLHCRAPSEVIEAKVSEIRPSPYTAEHLEHMQQQFESVFVLYDVQQYMRDVCVAVRSSEKVDRGLSAFAADALHSASKAYAVLTNYTFVTPMMTKMVAPSVLGHRIRLESRSVLPFSKVEEEEDEDEDDPNAGITLEAGSSMVGVKNFLTYQVPCAGGEAIYERQRPSWFGETGDLPICDVDWERNRELVSSVLSRLSPPI